ncbi:hypothetical protein RFI_34082 [Reticulomyxa filosa]|uniref:RanBP2-type domain-containing protein n=1 Tax=Reticulomyxa filosa TaxID=46433 RepID=X6LN26_RETFI|nr:hypothetical protein RFI_34082 [Reticulomyxa filosa]|eukprot:ETO03328.1 hypothetical protein RFI_34082 [Reticulomyxa filosa]
MSNNQEGKDDEDIKESRDRGNVFRSDQSTFSHRQDGQNQDTGEWKCTICQKSNKQQYQRCIECQTPKSNYSQPKIQHTPIFVLLNKRSSVPWRNTENFDCIVAIDFGTDGTSMGINIKGKDAVRLVTDWSSSGICDKKEVKNKTKTALLMDQNHKNIAFGNEAWTKYQAPDRDADKWLLFHRFKMDLYDVAGEYQVKKQSIVKRELKSINGVCVKSEIVFIGALKFCKQKAIEYFKQNNITVNENKIQWVITVPAIWSEEAKSMMKQWAQQAEIWSPSIPNQLLIVLEPECASMCMMLEMKDKLDTVQFKTGDCYMMMDLGAGTADMVCHEITGPFEVKEMVASFGGPWGSYYINKDIEAIFDKIFTIKSNKKSDEKKMKEFQATHPIHYLQLLENIEKSKQRFFNNKKTTGVYRIEIPYEFDQFMQDNIPSNLEELVSNFKYLEESGHEYDQEYLSLSCKLWMKLFDKRIDPIIKQMDEVLKRNENILSDKLKYICLVGGFSQSPYLQHRLKQHYEPKYTFVMSERPVFSVVEGAAQLARIPSFISSRIVKYTYGTWSGLPIEHARSHSKISEDHISKHKFINDITNQEYVDNCFNVFVNKDEEVKVGQMVEHSYSKRSKSDKIALTLIYRSEEIDPGVITGCERLGCIEIPYPEDFDAVKDCFYVRFYFGETMIRVTITIKGREYVEHEVQIKYDFGVQHLDAIS